ncbi:MAG: creatininase family protein [Phycisphaerae bacterium]|nr:creatininase family protein [Phycisphaerae bacterium]
MSSQQDKFFPVMEQMTVKTVRKYLERKQSIIVPVGVIEQHGYHLPLNTDALIAGKIARLAGQRADTLVGPTILQLFSGGGLPGTINISPAVMSLVISDTLMSLAAQGFRNFYLLLGHGGSENTHALNDSVKILLRNNPAFKNVLVTIIPVWSMNSPGIGWSKAINKENPDWHAGWLETSLIMALEPELVRMDEMELDKEPYLSQQIAHPDNYQHAQKIVDDPLVVPRMSQRSEIKVGVMGHPEKADPTMGKEIVDDIVKNLTARIEKIEAKADGVYKEVEFKPEPLIF